jgi:hypothetical protein
VRITPPKVKSPHKKSKDRGGVKKIGRAQGVYRAARFSPPLCFSGGFSVYLFRCVQSVVAGA